MWSNCQLRFVWYELSRSAAVQVAELKCDVKVKYEKESGVKPDEVRLYEESKCDVSSASRVIRQRETCPCEDRSYFRAGVQKWKER